MDEQQQNMQNPMPGSTDSSQGGNFTPVKEGSLLSNLSKRNKIILAIIALLAIVVPAVGYYTYTTTTVTESQALNSCDTSTGWINCNECGPPPGYSYCQSPGDAPAQGSCKPKGNWCSVNARWECRPKDCPLEIWQCNTIGTRKEWQLIQGCSDPTPTPQSMCPDTTYCTDDPNICNALPASPDGSNLSSSTNVCKTSAGTQGCCAPKSEPTPTPESICQAPYTCTLKADLPISDEDKQKYCQITNNTPTSPICRVDGQEGYCCNIPTPTPTETPTPTLTPTPNPSESPTPTQACILPVISVTVECETCGI